MSEIVFLKKNNWLRNIILPLCLISTLLAACGSIDVFEKNTAFKNHTWKGSDAKTIGFTITDTVSRYNIYLVFRHTDAYNYNNIWLKITRKGPDTTYSQQVDIRLAENDKGWLGSGMDDIWEHRILLIDKPALFNKSGKYEFVMEHIMRQEPLQHVMNIGLRVEKVKP
jgi:gliding motility-associated lipoprotein GldH